MHPSILAKRKGQAVGNIVRTASALVNHFGGDPLLAEALEPKGIKDPAAAEMMRLEALSNLLLWVAIHNGAVKESAPAPSEDPGVTAVTETEPTRDERPTLDDFPAHVVEAPSEGEDDDFEAKPKRRSTTKRAKKS